MPLNEIDGSSCCLSNNFGPKFNNEKKHMLSKETGKETLHAQNQLCKIKWNVLSQIPFSKSHNFKENFTSFGVLFGTSVH
jgi:hypothetical protein